MKLFGLLLTLFIYTLPLQSNAQEFEVPNYLLRVKEDYAKYEKDVVAAAKWLLEKPVDEQTFKRKEVSAFVVEWVDGSPTVNCEITPIILEFEKKNDGMLVMYMAATAQYVLENNYTKALRPKHLFAIETLITFYNKNKRIKKDKKMEKLIKAKEDGKLNEWMDENMKVGG
jgi:hypothetical protein